MGVRGRFGLAFGIAALAGSAACGNRPHSMDNGLKDDLAAARTAGTSRVSISPLELGERAAPAVVQHAPRPQKPANPSPVQTAPPPTVVAQTPQPAAASDPQPQPREPSPSVQPQPAQAPNASRPTPVRGETDGHHGRYKTEAEIFQQMPWIRP